MPICIGHTSCERTSYTSRQRGHYPPFPSDELSILLPFLDAGVGRRAATPTTNRVPLARTWSRDSHLGLAGLGFLPVTWRVAGPLSRGGSCGCPIPRGFRGVGGFAFPRKEVKTPTLPKAGRVGHPENLNQILRVHALQRKGWPLA